MAHDNVAASMLWLAQTLFSKHTREDGGTRRMWQPIGEWVYDGVPWGATGGD